MKDINLKEKEDIAVKRNAPIIPLSMIVIGIVLLVIGIIAVNTTDMSKYYKSTDIHESYNASEINNIDLEIGFMVLDVKKSSSDKIEVNFENVPEETKVKVDGDTFKVYFEDQNSWGFGNFSWASSLFGGNNNLKAELYLPEKVYNKFECETGAGKLTLDGIECNEFKIETGAGDSRVANVKCGTANIDTGAGNFDADNINCEGMCDIDTGVGNTDLKNTTTGGLNVDVGVGNLDFEGTVNGDIDADCGVGNVKIDLTNPSSDFSGGKNKISKDAGIGDIDITFDNKF